MASIADIVVNGSGYPAWIAAKGITEDKPWPAWCILLMVLLIGASVIWIPLVAICRYGLKIKSRYLGINYCEGKNRCRKSSFVCL